MKLYLSHDTKVSELKKSFQDHYPYLKIEFFRTRHSLGEGSTWNEMVPGSATLIEVTGQLREGEIEIKPGYKVFEVEQLFQNSFGLPVQIFRKTRFSWIETTKTDHLNLKKQNDMGKENCHAIYDEEVLL